MVTRLLPPRIPRIRARRRRILVGAPPGTLQPDPDAPPPVVRVITYGPDHFDERVIEDVAALEGLRAAGHRLWIDVDGLGDVETIQELGRIFGLHRLALEDVLNVPQRAKAEEYADQLFIVARMVSLGERLEREQISLFLGRDFVITFQERPGDCLEPVRDRLRRGSGRIHTADADYLAYAILDAIIDHYFPVLEAYGDRLERLEDDVLERPTRTTVAGIHEIRHELIALRRTIWPMRELVNTIHREPNPLIDEETRLYLRDCHDHVIQVIDLLESYREIAASLIDVYLSSVSNRMNEVMKALTVIATIFLPLSFIAGVYGMNFNPAASPYNMPELNWHWGYPLTLALMVVTAVGLLFYFRRKDWL